jgi:hypothetical protein
MGGRRTYRPRLWYGEIAVKDGFADAKKGIAERILE